MTTFLQMHVLTAYPPSNTNRDDLGRPKTAIMGGVQRLRLSSQSLKRAWRTSDVFQKGLDTTGKVHKGSGAVFGSARWPELLGVRTKQVGGFVYRALVGAEIARKDAYAWAQAIGGAFGSIGSAKFKAKDDDAAQEKALEIAQMAHISPDERAAVEALVAALIEEKRAPSKDELKLLRKPRRAVDTALFGRMLASSPEFNVEAAVQVGHALTTHEAVVEDDFFSAVDDLNTSADTGAGHIGEAEFGSGVFYVYVAVNRDLLVENLGGDEALAARALKALARAVTQTSPSGKRNAYGSHVIASYARVERSTQQPRNLSVAFLKPMRAKRDVGLLEASVKALEDTATKMDAVYGDCVDATVRFNASTGEGTLGEVEAFWTEGLADA